MNVVVATLLKWICHWAASQAQTFSDTGLLIIKLSHNKNMSDKVKLLLLRGKSFFALEWDGGRLGLIHIKCRWKTFTMKRTNEEGR